MLKRTRLISRSPASMLIAQIICMARSVVSHGLISTAPPIDLLRHIFNIKDEGQAQWEHRKSTKNKTNTHKKIQNPNSRVQNHLPKSRIQNPNSRIQNPERKKSVHDETKDTDRSTAAARTPPKRFKTPRMTAAFPTDGQGIQYV